MTIKLKTMKTTDLDMEGDASQEFLASIGDNAADGGVS